MTPDRLIPLGVMALVLPSGIAELSQRSMIAFYPRSLRITRSHFGGQAGAIVEDIAIDDGPAVPIGQSVSEFFGGHALPPVPICPAASMIRIRVRGTQGIWTSTPLSTARPTQTTSCEGEGLAACLSGFSPSYARVRAADAGRARLG